MPLAPICPPEHSARGIFFFFIYLTTLGLCCYIDFSLVAENGGYSLVAMLGLLIAVASLVAEHGL